ncbi:hypothetical protein Tco_0688771 [Tanacetum coccineum]
MQSKEGKVESRTALDIGLVVTESNETESERHVSSSRSGKDTHAENANINSVNDQVPLVESKDVQIQEGKVDMESSGTMLDEQDTSSRSREMKQYRGMHPSDPYDTHLLEKVDSNTIPDSTNMCPRSLLGILVLSSDFKHFELLNCQSVSLMQNMMPVKQIPERIDSRAKIATRPSIKGKYFKKDKTWPPQRGKFIFSGHGLKPYDHAKACDYFASQPVLPIFHQFARFASALYEC